MLSKVFSGIIMGGLIVFAVMAIHINRAQADTEPNFIPVSVLAENQADYGVDENLWMIPSISLDIIADKLQDEGQTMSSLPVIFFTSGISPDNKDKHNPNKDVPDDRIKDKNENKGKNGEPGNANGPNNGNAPGTGNGTNPGNTNSQDNPGTNHSKKPEQNKDKGNPGNGKGKP